MVRELRKINRFTLPNMRSILANLTLDTLRYIIPNAENKSTVRRIIERPFRKQKLNEIQNLIDYIPKDSDYLKVNVNQLISKGESLIAAGNWQGAILSYNAFLNEYPHNKDSRFTVAYYSRGHAYQKLGNNLQAVNDFNKAITLHTEYAEAYYEIGCAYSQLGNFSMATQALKMAANLGVPHAQQILKSWGTEWQ